MSDTVPVVMMVEMNDCIDCGNRLGDNLSVLVPGPAHHRTILPTGLLMLGPEEPPKYILLCEKQVIFFVVIRNRELNIT